MADGEGFEPPDELPRQRFSRPSHSTALPTIQNLVHCSLSVKHPFVKQFLFYIPLWYNNHKGDFCMDNDKPEQIIVDEYVLKPIPATPEFAKLIFDINQEDVERFKHWMNGGKYTSVDKVLDFYKNGRQDDDRWHFAMYGIFKNGELLGEIGLSAINVRNQEAEIGYWLRKSARGQGIIDKLLPTIEKLGFETLNLRKLSIWCDADNIGSRSKAENHGYIQEGLLRERKLWPDGSIHDTAVFGKLKREWQK